MNTVKILVVEDQPELLELISETLSGPERSVATAYNGADALRLLRKEPFDLVLSDIRMPKLDGIGLLRKVTECSLDVDVILLTGYGTVENAVDCVKSGAADYLLKPFRIDQLCDAVDKVLRERSLRQQRKSVGNLAKMLGLNNALQIHTDMRSLVKEFVLQVGRTFEPDGIAMFFDDGRAMGQMRHILVGPIFRDDARIRDWFLGLSQSLLRQGKPRLLGADLLERVARRSGLAHDEGQGGHVGMVSAMIAPVSSPVSKTGAIAVLRSHGQPPYTLQNLQLLTIFGAHASSCFESFQAIGRLRDVNRQMVTSFVSAVEAKDPYTRGHSEQVSIYAGALGREFSLTGRELEILRIAGTLHDIGKIGIPDSILNKPERLTADEYEVIVRHPVIGRDILAEVDSLHDVLPVVYHHHERVDGTGYPDGLAGQGIPFLSRIISVVDGFEAMISARAYQPARSLEKAKTILADGAGSQWDSEVVEAWLALLHRKEDAFVLRRPPAIRCAGASSLQA
jgi:response regulator RpfG family c-di-GMP phosphodiesterase